MSGAKVICKEAYISFITGYKEIMYRIAYGYLGDETKALDAVDEAVYLGFIHRNELRQPEYLKTWLTRILINECYRILRKGKREVVVEVLPEESCRTMAYTPPFEDSLSLKLVIQDLPEDLKKVIVLRYFGGYTIADTAEILKIPEGTVATRTRKALGILKVGIIDQKGEEFYDGQK